MIKKAFKLKDLKGKEIDGDIKILFNQDKYRLIPESFKDHEKTKMKKFRRYQRSLYIEQRK